MPAATVPGELLRPFPLDPHLDGEARDRFGRYVVFPFTVFGLPGVLGYALEKMSDPKQPDSSTDPLQIAIGIAKKVAIAAGVIAGVVLVVAAILVVAEIAAGSAVAADTLAPGP